MFRETFDSVTKINVLQLDVEAESDQNCNKKVCRFQSPSGMWQKRNLL